MKTEHRLIKCLDEILAGKTTLEKCAAKYPRLAGELTALLEVSTRITAAGTTPGKEFKNRVAAALMKEMETTASQYTDSHRPGWFKNIFSPQTFAFRCIVAVVVLSLSSSGTVYASRDSLPGDTLYPVKRTVETARLALTFTPDSKASVYLERVHERVEETVKVTSRDGNLAVSALRDVPADIDRAFQQIAGISKDRERLLQRLIEITGNEQKNLAPLVEGLPADGSSALTQSLDALRRGNLIGEISYHNPSFLASSPSIYDESLELKVFKIVGTLLDVEDDDWNVGGVSLINVNRPSGVPEIGAGLRVEGIVSGNTTFIWRLDNETFKDGKTVIEGIVSEKSDDNSIVCVGGLQFRDVKSLQPAPVGTFLRIVGTVVEGRFHSDDDEDNENAGINENDRDGAQYPGQTGIEGNHESVNENSGEDEENSVNQYDHSPVDNTVGISPEDHNTKDQPEDSRDGDSYVKEAPENSPEHEEESNSPDRNERHNDSGEDDRGHEEERD
jgi:hypothetical protein